MRKIKGLPVVGAVSVPFNLGVTPFMRLNGFSPETKPRGFEFVPVMDAIESELFYYKLDYPAKVVEVIPRVPGKDAEYEKEGYKLLHREGQNQDFVIIDIDANEERVFGYDFWRHTFFYLRYVPKNDDGSFVLLGTTYHLKAIMV